MSEPHGEIRILGRDNDESDRAWGFSRDEERLALRSVPVDILRDQLAGFLASMSEALTVVPNVLGQFEVDELTLSLDVTAKGSVSLLGTGGELGGSGGLSLTLKRRGAAAGGACQAR